MDAVKMHTLPIRFCPRAKPHIAPRKTGYTYGWKDPRKDGPWAAEYQHRQYGYALARRADGSIGVERVRR